MRKLLARIFRPRVVVVVTKRKETDTRLKFVAKTAQLAAEIGRPNPLDRTNAT